MPNAYITLNICFLLATCCHHHMYHSMKWSHRNTKCWTGWRDPADSGLLPLPHRVLNMAFGVFSGAYNTAKVRQLYGNTRRRMWYRCAATGVVVIVVPWCSLGNGFHLQLVCVWCGNGLCGTAHCKGFIGSSARALLTRVPVCLRLIGRN